MAVLLLVLAHVCACMRVHVCVCVCMYFFILVYCLSHYNGNTTSISVILQISGSVIRFKALQCYYYKYDSHFTIS